MVVKDEAKFHPESISRYKIIANVPTRFVELPSQPLSKVLYLLAFNHIAYNPAKAATSTNDFLQKLEAAANADAGARAGAQNDLGVDMALYEQALPQSKSYTNLISKAHDYAEIVLYFDDLIGKQHLLAEKVKLISYKKLPNTSLNFMIAKKDTDYHTTANLTEELQNLSILDPQAINYISSKILDDAIGLSGSVIMRADARKVNTSEMIGLVLSSYVAKAAYQHLLRSINDPRHKKNHRQADLVATSFLMLDDYAAYFNSKQDKLRADILCMQILKYRDNHGTAANAGTDTATGNQYLMVLMVVESKFLGVFQKGSADSSLKQTLSTVNNIYNVLRRQDNATTLDRRPYLNLFANMLSENSEHYGMEADKELQQVQKLIRDERIDMILKGCSFVFSHEHSEQPVLIAPKYVESNIKPTNKKDAYQLPVLQICFHRQAVKDIFSAYQDVNANDPMHLLQLFEEFCQHDDKDLIAAYFTDNKVYSRHLTPTQLQTPLAVPNIVRPSSSPQTQPQPQPQPVDSSTDTATGTSTTDTSARTSSSDAVNKANPSDVDVDLDIIQPIVDHEPLWDLDFDEPPQVQTPPQPESEPEPEPELGPEPETEPLVEVEPEIAPVAEDTEEGSATTNANPELAQIWKTRPQVHQIFAQSNESEFEIETPERKRHLAVLERDLIAHYANQIGISQREIHVTDRNVAANTYIFVIKSSTKVNYKKVKACSEHMLSDLGYYANVSEIPKHISVVLSIPQESGLEPRITVPYFFLLKQHEFNYGDADKPFFNSKFIVAQSESSNEIVYFDQRKYDSHTIVAGTTGSGKTVFLQNLIIDMTLTNTPDELELIIIDGKGAGDFSNFVGLPHIRYGRIINTEEHTCKVLDALEEEMNARQRTFEQGFPGTAIKHKFSKIDEYNKAAIKLGLKPMSRVFLIWDEFTSFMADKDMRNRMLPMLTKLATKARSAGIYMILVAQRPDAKIFDGQIKSNCNNRICFCVKDQQNTRIVMGEGCQLSAKDLGRGEMIYSFSDTFKLAQAPFSTNEMILALTQAIESDYAAMGFKPHTESLDDTDEYEY